MATRKQRITLDELAIMVKKGFDGVDKHFDEVPERFEGMERRFNQVQSSLDRIEKQILTDHERRIRVIEEALAVPPSSKLRQPA